MAEILVQPESTVIPAEVRRAVGLLWLSLPLAAATTIIDGRHVYRGNAYFSVIIQIVTFRFFALLIWKLSQGRSWARITFLCIFVVGCFISLLVLFSQTHHTEVFQFLFSSCFHSADRYPVLCRCSTAYL